MDPSHEQHDRIRVTKIGGAEVALESAKTLNRQSGVADEFISSQSYDWITKKVYIAVDRVGTKKSGRIEACPIDSSDGCTILLSNDFGMHSLVVDPIEGYVFFVCFFMLNVNFLDLNFFKHFRSCFKFTKKWHSLMDALLVEWFAQKPFTRFNQKVRIRLVNQNFRMSFILRFQNIGNIIN